MRNCTFTPIVSLTSLSGIILKKIEISVLTHGMIQIERKKKGNITDQSAEYA